MPRWSMTIERIGPPRSTRLRTLTLPYGLPRVRLRVLPRAAHFRIVGFNRLASAAHRAGVAGVHRQPNSVTKEPRGFHAAIQHPLNLPRRDAFLAAAQQVDDLQPQMQGQMAILENRPHAHREGLPAGVALVQARTGRLAVQSGQCAWFRCTVRANGAIRPKARLNVGKSALLRFETVGRSKRA